MSSTTTDNKEPNVETLSKRYLHFLTSGEFADITLIVGKDKIPFKAHKWILIFGSSYFQQLLTQGKATTRASTDKQIDSLVIKGVEPDVFAMFLQFLYTKIPPTDINTALPLLMCATKFNVPSLIEAAGALLKKSLTLESALTTLEQAVHFKCGYLQAAALEFICKQAYKILETDEFNDLSEAALRLILQRDELQAYDEMQVFEATIRWAHAECGRREMNSTYDKYMRLKSLLRFIRLPIMSHSEFASEVDELGILTLDERLDILEAINTTKDLRINWRFSEFFPTTERLYYIPETPTQVVLVARNSALRSTTTICALNQQSDIKFKVNRPVWISRIRFSPCRSSPPPYRDQNGSPTNISQVAELPLTITLKLKDSFSLHTIGLSPFKKCKETVKVNVTEGDDTSAIVEFNPPVRIKAGTWYLITASFNALGQGQINYQRFSPETSRVCCQRGDEPLVFYFQNDRVNNNGQIAEIGYKLDE